MKTILEIEHLDTEQDLLNGFCWLSNPGSRFYLQACIEPDGYLSHSVHEAGFMTGQCLDANTETVRDYFDGDFLSAFDFLRNAYCSQFSCKENETCTHTS